MFDTFTIDNTTFKVVGIIITHNDETKNNTIYFWEKDEQKHLFNKCSLTLDGGCSSQYRLINNK
jgi:hypothetical protein